MPTAFSRCALCRALTIDTGPDATPETADIKHMGKCEPLQLQIQKVVLEMKLYEIQRELKRKGESDGKSATDKQTNTGLENGCDGRGAKRPHKLGRATIETCGGGIREESEHYQLRDVARLHVDLPARQDQSQGGNADSPSGRDGESNFWQVASFGQRKSKRPA